MSRLTVAQYDEIKAIRWSQLKYMAVSPLMYRWRIDHPEPTKDAYVIGNAAHCAILEPEKFAERFAVYDGVRNPKFKEWQEWQAANPGVQSLKPDEMALVRAIGEAVRNHRVAGPLVRGGRCEEVVTWDDEATGLACKGRLDYLRPDFVLDLKTTRDPAPRRFERDATEYGYAPQLAFYHDGATRARLIDGKMRPFIIAPQNDEPFDVAVFQLKPETLEYGRVFYRSLLTRLLECTEADYWPGVAPELLELGISPWAPSPYPVQESEDF